MRSNFVDVGTQFNSFTCIDSAGSQQAIFTRCEPPLLGQRSQISRLGLFRIDPFALVSFPGSCLSPRLKKLAARLTASTTAEQGRIQLSGTSLIISPWIPTLFQPTLQNPVFGSLVRQPGSEPPEPHRCNCPSRRS